MFFRKKTSIILIGMLLLIATAGCAKNGGQPMEAEVSDNMPLPVEAGVEEAPPIEEGLPVAEPTPKEYDNCYEAYLDILTEKREEIFNLYVGEDDGVIAIRDVFGDETPELLYVYWRLSDDGEYSYPMMFLKILSYTKEEGVESVFDSIVFKAAGGGNGHCVYLTPERELMLYRSNFGAQQGWGFWQIIPNQNLEETDEYHIGIYSSDLAKLYFARWFEENEEKPLGDRVEKTVYKRSGEEISKEQYDVAAKEIMGNIERVLLQDIISPEYELYSNDDLWKDIAPFKAECMTYAEAIAWLETQIEKSF